jgi:hypothetical protein
LRLLILAWTAGIGADWAFLVTTLIVAYNDGGAFAVGLLGLVRMLPATIVALVVMIPPRIPNERALVAIKLIRAAAAAGAAVGLVAGVPFALIAFSAGVIAASGSLVRPTHQAMLPSMARHPDELIAANVGTSTGEGLGTFIGPAVGGAVLLVAGPAAAIASAAGLFVLAAGSVATIRIPRAAAAVTPERTARTAPPLVAGFRALVERPAAGLTIVGLGCQVLARGLLTTLIVVASIELLGLGEGGVGALNAAIGAGGFVGAASALALAGRSRVVPIYALALSGWGLPIAVIGLLPSAPLALVAMAVLGTSNAILDISAFTLLQRTLPNEQRTAVFAFLEGVIGVGIATGGVLAPLLVAVFGVRSALILTGAILPAAAILTWPWVSRLDREIIVPERQLRLLRRVPMFALLPLTMLERLAGALVPVAFKANEVVMREGEPGDRYYIVSSGSVEVTSEGHAIGTNGPGDGIGEIALLRRVPRTATVRATVDSELYALDGPDFISVICERLGNAQALAHPDRRATDAIGRGTGGLTRASPRADERSVRRVGIELAHALRQGSEHARLDRGVSIHEAVELPVPDDEDAAGGRHRGRRRPRPLIDQRDLAEELPRPEHRQLAPLPLDTDAAVDDDKELVAGTAFLGQDLAGRNVDLIDEPAQLTEIPATQIRKERHIAQQRDLLIHPRLPPRRRRASIDARCRRLKCSARIQGAASGSSRRMRSASARSTVAWTSGKRSSSTPKSDCAMTRS